MIVTCVQKGSSVYVYGEHNSMMFTVSGTLVGYTQNTVSVKDGNNIKTWNEHHALISSHATY